MVASSDLYPCEERLVITSSENESSAKVIRLHSMEVPADDIDVLVVARETACGFMQSDESGHVENAWLALASVPSQEGYVPLSPVNGLKYCKEPPSVRRSSHPSLQNSMFD